MTTSDRPILQIAIAVPLDHLFDYLPPPATAVDALQPGVRLRVPFGTKTRVGILIRVTTLSAVAPEKLKAALAVLDTVPALPARSLQLIHWAHRYYHYPIGEVIANALPTALNQGKTAHCVQPLRWCLTEKGQAILPDSLPQKYHRQMALLAYLKQHPQGFSQATLVRQFSYANPVLQALAKKEWVVACPIPPATMPNVTTLSVSLNTAQNQAVQYILSHSGQFCPCLLDGVTGSGKTEVYLHVVEKIIAQGLQALILVPEINLTPQMIERFKQRFTATLVVFHSKLSDQERLQAWLLARDGVARIVIGTRSAVWIPLMYPGVLIVDEEHDPAYKQTDHFRYSARDVAVMRAQQENIPIVLGSATPALESLYNVQQQRYHHLVLLERAGTAVHPEFYVVDMRQQPAQITLSTQLKAAITRCLAHQQQVLLFINRRGYAPVFMCYQCGWIAHCQHCDARLTYHENHQRLFCHHCGASRPINKHCPQCQHTTLNLLGQGTERIEEILQQQFPAARIARIDSDSTQGKQAMQKILTRIHAGEIDILIGTQMLAKGHHFSKVTLVGVINMDNGLYSIDFRASERMAQLLMQVAGRAGRADQPGQVIVQTYHPEHPLLRHLVHQDYATFAQVALSERQQAYLPPYCYLALLRAEAKQMQQALHFLSTIKQAIQKLSAKKEVVLWGPVTAPMERRAGWYRAQLLLQAHQRPTLHRLLDHWLSSFEFTKINQLRWSLDIDPQELF